MKRHWVPGVLVAVVGAGSTLLNADFRSPPRYDGAGYAVLGLALATGRGYHEIHTPTSARHAHYPPGYPLALAAVWRAAGKSVGAAHALSTACTVAAIVAAWWWFRTMYGGRVASAAGLALACNWSWGRNGAAILSEPLYLLLGQLALLAGTWAGRRGGYVRGAVHGALLAACMLTRHVGVVLALAVGVDLMLRRRRASLLAAGLSATVLVLPWVAWLATSRRATQVGLFAGDGPAALLARQFVFYVRRLPDQWVGPVVEIGSNFAGASPAFVLAHVWAVAATGLVAWGWSRALRSPGRRLAGLVPLTTFPLLLAWPFTEAGRFLIPLVPCLIVGAIEGLAGLASRWRLRRPRAWAAWAVVVASLPYPAYAIVAGRAEAQRRADRPFDAACAWLARPGVRPGPVLSGHPAEVFWMTGRVGFGPDTREPGEIARAIDRFGVTHLLVDERRYARAPDSPLESFVRRHPERVRRVWGGSEGATAVVLFEVLPGPGNED